MKSTKFILCMIGTVGLLTTAFAGKFTGDLGMWTATIIGSYVGGNTLITRAAIANGKGATE